MILQKKTYDTLALIQRLFTHLATFTVAIMSIWGLTEHADQITATISAISALLAGWLMVCSNAYHKEGLDGHITFINTEDKDGGADK